MKNDQTYNDKGSVLVIALMTMTILTMICATSLYITSQNTGAGVQTAAWQQSLTGAEMGIDAAVRALNQSASPSASPNPNPWTNWKTVNSTLPTPAPSSSPVLGYTYEPTGGNAVGSGSPPPDTSHYYYLPSANLSISYPNTEGTTAVNAWVTIDTWGTLSNSNGSWYRVRSTGQAAFQANSVYKRVSSNRLDSDLRNTIAMNLYGGANRKGGSSLGPTRTIEAILQPVPKGGSARAITLSNWLAMTGGGSVDAFSSPNGQWSSAFRDASNPMLVAEGATGNQAKFANTGQTYVYGGVTYSGNAPTNVNANSGNPPVKDVLGQVSTPAVVSLPTPTDPTAVSGNSGHYNWTYQNPWSGTTTNYSFNSSTAYSSGGVPTAITANGTASSPGLIIINGDFTVPGGKSFTINPTTTGSPPVASSSNSNVIIWVQGKFTTSGSGMITQSSGTSVTWIVDGDLTVSGSSYNNQNGTAATDSFVGIGNNKFTDSGSGTFVGTVNAPGYAGTISGSGDYTGAFAGSNLTISGSGSFHYDEALSGGSSNPAIGNYAYASWFEDNSDPTHKDTKGNYVVY